VGLTIQKIKLEDWQALKAKPEFTISFERIQLALELFADSKLTPVVLHIDLLFFC
jgi:hypothetical protein